MRTQTILWRRLDLPGYESARLSRVGTDWQIVGTAVFKYENNPCRLDYGIVCDSAWKTRSVKVTGWVGETAITLDMRVDAAQTWQMNGTPETAVAGCIDIDLNFSPSTNLLPIRRLNLAIGQEAAVTAAWLRFPEFKLEPFEQLYRRINPETYHYESSGGAFVAELTVNEAGFATRYADLWQAEAVR